MDIPRKDDAARGAGIDKQSCLGAECVVWIFNRHIFYMSSRMHGNAYPNRVRLGLQGYLRVFHNSVMDASLGTLAPTCL